MALLKDFTDANTQLTVTNAYHRVVGLTFQFETGTPAVGVVVGVYASQAARNAGAQPLYRFTKQLDPDAAAAFTGMAAFRTLVARVYTAVVKTDPQWSGGTDAPDPTE